MIITLDFMDAVAIAALLVVAVTIGLLRARLWVRRVTGVDPPQRKP